jgi:D-alanyl-lipoteichoic acid acyltransferase DltB (MBOAT superfamily)
LSSWLRDYLFQPLGGIRRNNWLTLRNLVITMFLCGLWHGAAWNFVLWGLYLGTMMTLRRGYDVYVAPIVDRWAPQTSTTTWVRGGLERIVMICGTLYGFMIFRSMSGSQIVDMTMALGDFESWSFLISRFVKMLVIAAPVLLLDIWEYRAARDEIFIRSPALVQTVTYAAALMLFLMIGQFNVDAFIYFQF